MWCARVELVVVVLLDLALREVRVICLCWVVAEGEGVVRFVRVVTLVVEM